MPKSVSRAIMALLFLAAVSGWAAVGILAFQVYIPAGAPDSSITGIVSKYLGDYVEVEAEGARYERITHYFLPGSPALAAISAESQSGAAGVPGLAIEGTPAVTVLWRSGDQAMVEIKAVLRDATDTSRDLGEHVLLRLRDGIWKIEARWRIAIDPGTPLVPVETPSPEASVTP